MSGSEFCLCFRAFCFGKPDTFVGKEYRQQQTDTATNQRREFIIHLRQQQIRNRTRENAQINKADILADFRPGRNKAQRQHRNDKTGDKVNQPGFLANGKNIRITQNAAFLQLAKAEPGRRTDRTKRHRHRVHDERKNRNLHRLEAQANKNRRGNRRRRAKTARALNHKGECPADNHQLRHRIRIDIAEPLADNIDAAGRFHHAVKENRAKNDGNRR